MSLPHLRLQWQRSDLPTLGSHDDANGHSLRQEVTEEVSAQQSDRPCQQCKVSHHSPSALDKHHEILAEISEKSVE